LQFIGSALDFPPALKPDGTFQYAAVPAGDYCVYAPIIDGNDLIAWAVAVHVSSDTVTSCDLTDANAADAPH
jgi:hypothetical protein